MGLGALNGPFGGLGARLGVWGPILANLARFGKSGRILANSGVDLGAGLGAFEGGLDPGSGPGDPGSGFWQTLANMGAPGSGMARVTSKDEGQC
jgi:hypothetical protein